MKLLVAILVVGAVFGAFALVVASKVDFIKDKPLPTPTPRVFSEKRLFGLVNEWRVKNGLPDFKESNISCDYASRRLEVVSKDYSHAGFSAQQACVDKACVVKENLARGYFTEDETLEGWINSPKHVDSLSTDLKYSCIKCSKNLCVHIFSSL